MTCLTKKGNGVSFRVVVDSMIPVFMNLRFVIEESEKEPNMKDDDVNNEDGSRGRIYSQKVSRSDGKRIEAGVDFLSSLSHS